MTLQTLKRHAQYLICLQFRQTNGPLPVRCGISLGLDTCNEFKLNKLLRLFHVQDGPQLMGGAFKIWKIGTGLDLESEMIPHVNWGEISGSVWSVEPYHYAESIDGSYECIKVLIKSGVRHVNTGCYQCSTVLSGCTESLPEMS